jgi:hypothetical protein
MRITEFITEAANPAQQAAIAIAKKKKKRVSEGSDSQLDINQLAAISDAALDAAYGYGRSSPGNTFGWQANLKSAAYAKQMIDRGVTDIEVISDAIHKGWNVTASAFVQDPDQFDDTEKLKAAGKLEAKLQQREKLMNVGYGQLPDDEQEKDRVVARALLQALTGEQGVAEDWNKVNKHDKTDGMSGKAVKAYRRENPGSKLKTAVTTKPSKLKKGGKAASRRKSFCARMGGMKKHNAGAKTKRDPDSPINKALRRWNCESVEQLQELVMLAEQFVQKSKK